jgi:hypothetical protein
MIGTHVLMMFGPREQDDPVDQDKVHGTYYGMGMLRHRPHESNVKVAVISFDTKKRR